MSTKDIKLARTNNDWCFISSIIVRVEQTEQNLHGVRCGARHQNMVSRYRVDARVVETKSEQQTVTRPACLLISEIGYIP